MILAAIDIGSNAARLLIMEARQYKGGETDYTKLNFLRVPLRLGGDVFQTGYISREKAEALSDTMKIYALLMKIYKVEHFRACATSAMRDAANGREIAAAVRSNTGIGIQIISGSEEAGIIYETHIAENMDPDQPFLYIDVGGGSTELTLFSKGHVLFKKSFNIGTIRLLNNLVTEKQLEDLKLFVKEHTKSFKNLRAIGSGGNINKIYTLSRTKEGKSLNIELLKDYYKELNGAGIEERMHLYKLRRDRADVIVPALQIYTSVMRWAGIAEIYVPKIGLADGIIKMLFMEHR